MHEQGIPALLLIVSLAGSCFVGQPDRKIPSKYIFMLFSGFMIRVLKAEQVRFLGWRKKFI